MGTQVQLAVNRIFSVDGLAASNIKFFPGASRDVSAEQMASEVNKIISSIEAGDFTDVDAEAYCAD